MTRRFYPIDLITVGGVAYRIIPGRKGPNDLRLDRWNNSGWEAASMSSTLFEAVFYYENEEALYPRAQGYKGGAKFMATLWKGIHHGYVAACDEIEYEKRLKNSRLFDVDDERWFNQEIDQGES